MFSERLNIFAENVIQRRMQTIIQHRYILVHRNIRVYRNITVHRMLFGNLHDVPRKCSDSALGCLPEYLTKYLARVGKRQVKGTVHLYKYWPLYRFSPTVCKYDTSQMTHRSSLTYQVPTCCCVPTARLYVTSIEVPCVWILSMINRYVKCPVA